jgi:hypothetical protein
MGSGLTPPPYAVVIFLTNYTLNIYNFLPAKGILRKLNQEIEMSKRILLPLLLMVLGFASWDAAITAIGTTVNSDETQVHATGDGTQIPPRE